MFGVIKKTVSAVTCFHPFFIEFLYSMRYKETLDEETLATDGKTLYVNPEWFVKEDKDTQIFAILHELMHKILLHPVRRMGRHPELWNIACDYAANGILHDSCITFDTERFYYSSGFKGMSAEAIYVELLKNPKVAEAVGKGIALPYPYGMPSGQRDLKDATETNSNDMEREVKGLVARAVELAGGQKALQAQSPTLATLAFEMLKVPEEAWHNKLQRYMQSVNYSKYTWNSINYRTLYLYGALAPAVGSASMEHLVLYVDTSGSCFDKATQANFSAHFNAIVNSVMPKHVTILYFDTEIRKRSDFYGGECDAVLEPVGGGFTDFRYLFTYAEENGIAPSVAIVLTDLEGAVPEVAPDFPVLWAITSKEIAPFGDSLYITVEE